MTVKELVEIAYKFTKIELYDGDKEEPVLYGFPDNILKYGDYLLDRIVECYQLFVHHDYPFLSVTMRREGGSDCRDC